MSILDALRVQKAEQQSVRDLAKLPQQIIIQMAQRGDIPADVAPVVINEKARMAKEMANLQALMAQGGGKAPTVMEQAIATNAQAESPGIPNAMPQGAPQAPQAPQGIPGTVATPELQAAGVSALPTGQMFNQQNFAGGGIVAFQPGGDVDLGEIVSQQQRQDPSFAGMFAPAEQPATEEGGFRRRYASLAEAIAEAQQARSPYRTPSPEEQALMEYQKGQKPRSQAEMSQQGWLRTLEAGLGIMGGTSPYALTNIGKGAESALKGYGEDIKEQRKREGAALVSAAEQARRQRLEKLEDVAAGEKLYEKDLEAEYRNAVLNKDTDLRNTTKIFFNEMVAKGANPDDPRTMAEARRKAYEYTGLAAQRVGTQQFGIESQNRREASNYVESRLGKQANPEALKMRRLEQEDKKNGTDTASTYRDSLFSEAYGRISRGETLSGPLGSAKPEAKSEPKAESKAGAKSTTLPPAAKAQLKEGFVTTFSNGQKWTLKNGQPERVQ